jgi:hypothetical protein
MTDINVFAPINQLGYGIASLNIIKNLAKKKTVGYWSIGQPQITDQQTFELIKSLQQNATYFNPVAPSLKIWHQFDMALRVGKGTNIGFPIFELDEFNAVENHHLHCLDRIFVCSEWAKNVIRSEMNADVRVVPLGVDSKIFNWNNTFNFVRTEKCIFFNCGKWEVRKGHDVLIEAFNRAFSANDKVELWMMCDNPFYSPEEQKEWESLYNQSNCKIIHRVNTQIELADVMAKTTCGVFPSRAEGWNLELLEMMALGKPVIATNYSAHTEFCNNSNSYLINITDKEDAYDGKWFNGQGQWASLNEPQIDQLAGYLRFIYNAWKDSNRAVLMNDEGIKTAQKFSWEHTADLVIENSLC